MLDTWQERRPGMAVYRIPSLSVSLREIPSTVYTVLFSSILSLVYNHHATAQPLCPTYTWHFVHLTRRVTILQNHRSHSQQDPAVLDRYLSSLQSPSLLQVSARYTPSPWGQPKRRRISLSPSPPLFSNRLHLVPPRTLAAPFAQN